MTLIIYDFYPIVIVHIKHTLKKQGASTSPLFFNKTIYLVKL